ncbi:MAG: hypothetical protein HGB31_02840 [Erysipelotrichaceae bacterium]|nr:hypothetical protein [Erysipelotrichaceae bacterium]
MKKLSRPMQIGLIVLSTVLSFSVFFVLSSGLSNLFILKAKTKEFTKAGMTISLTSDFYEKEIASQTAYYESQKYIVTVLKEEFTIFESIGLSTDISVKEYAELVIENNMIDSAIEEKDNLTFFKYEKTVNGKQFSYFATVHKSSDAFWLIQFACETKNAEDSQDLFIEWGQTIKLN